MIGMSSSRAAAEFATAKVVAAPKKPLRLKPFWVMMAMNSFCGLLPNSARDRRLPALPRQQLSDLVRRCGVAFHGPVRFVLGGLARPRLAVSLLMVRQVERCFAFRIPAVQR